MNIFPLFLIIEKCLQWVYNILNREAEVDKILYEDKDEETGFTMLRDSKWNDDQPTTLDILVLARKRIKSLRELDGSHLPLLKNIRDKATDEIVERYSLSKHQLRIYLHYPPSYQHLHVHFTHLMNETQGRLYFSSIHSQMSIQNANQ